jgi:peptidoglycan/xylan/chitin deacetylase (PgdA/CDA1 family)
VQAPGKIKRIFSIVKHGYQKLMNGNCAVLLYHRITNLKSDPQQLSVSPENFDKHLSYLKNNFRVLSTDEFTSLLVNRKSFPKNCVLITFDDGYADNYLEALPILEKYKLQALFYVATGTLNTDKEFWWDEMERILLSECNASENEITINKKKYILNNLNEVKRKYLYNELLPVMRKMPSAERALYIQHLANIFNSPAPRSANRAMSYEELRNLHASSSAVVGAHTHLHPSLGALNYDEQLKEIKTSKDTLEKALKAQILHFSYPFGTHNDFNNETKLICRQLGFLTAAANYPACANRASDIYSFPRFLVRNWTPELFESNLQLFFKQ